MASVQPSSPVWPHIIQTCTAIYALASSLASARLARSANCLDNSVNPLELRLGAQDAAPNRAATCGGRPPVSGVPPTMYASRGPAAGHNVHLESVRAVLHRQLGPRPGVVDQHPAVQQAKVDVRQRKEQQKQARRHPGLLVLALACFRMRYPVSMSHRLGYVFGMSPSRSSTSSTLALVMNTTYLPMILVFLGEFFFWHTTSVETDCLPSPLVMVYSCTGSPQHRPP